MKNPHLQPLFLFSLLLFSIAKSPAQSYLQTDTLRPDPAQDNISLTRFAGDSLVSSFIIHIKKEVKPHKHLDHSEHVYVLAGKGWMKLGEKEFEIKPGMLVFIPKGTVHSVKTTSKEPLKVLSIQAPLFDGKDRVMVE